MKISEINGFKELFDYIKELKNQYSVPGLTVGVINKEESVRIVRG